MDPRLQIILAALAVMFPFVSIYIDTLKHDWTRTVSSSFMPQFLLSPSDSASDYHGSLNVFQYAYSVDESLLESLDQYPDEEFAHPLVALLHGLYDSWTPEQPSLDLTVQYSISVCGVILVILVCHAVWNWVRPSPSLEIKNALSPGINVPSLLVPPSESVKPTPKFNSSGLFCTTLEDTIQSCSIPLANVEAILPPSLSEHLLADDQVFSPTNSSSNPQLAEEDPFELSEIVFAKPELSSDFSLDLCTPSGPQGSSFRSVLAAIPEDDSDDIPSEDNSFTSAGLVQSDMRVSSKPADTSANEERPKHLVSGDNCVLADSLRATDLLTAQANDFVDRDTAESEVGTVTLLALVPWVAPAIPTISVTTALEPSEATPSDEADMSGKHVQTPSSDSLDIALLTESDPLCQPSEALAVSESTLPVSPIFPQLTAAISGADPSSMTDSLELAPLSPVIVLVSPQACAEDDLLDFDSQVYEPPSDFPMMQVDSNLGDYLDDDVDEWGWTLINICLNESDCFVYTGSISAYVGDDVSDTARAGAEAYILDDAIPELYSHGILDIDGKDHRRARSEPPLSSLPFITRAEVEPLPKLEEPDMMSRYPDVALRFGIIQHDQAFRLYEPPGELCLAIREEKRALVIATRRTKRGKSPLYVRKVGLDREAFFAIFQRSLPPAIPSYADALRVGARLSRGLTVTVDPVQVAQRQRSATVSSKSFVSVNCNRGRQDQNVNGDGLMVRRPLIRRDSVCTPQRTRTQSGPMPVISKAQEEGPIVSRTKSCSSSVQQPDRVRSRPRSGSLQSNAANDDAPRLRTHSARPDLSVVRYAAAEAAPPPPPPPPPVRVRRRESAPCISRPPALSTIIGSPTIAPPAICVPSQRFGWEAASVRMAGAQVRGLVVPAAPFARIDDEDALDDVPGKVVDGRAARGSGAVALRVPSWVAM